jgi:hypothetical protein
MRIPAAIAFLGLAAQAGAQKVDVEFDESAGFLRYKTFAIRDGQINAKAPQLNNDLVRRKLENEIRQRLTARGLVEAAERPDLNVRYTLGAQSRPEVERFPAGWRGRRTRVVRTRTTEGTLVIDLRDASRRELVWRAVAVEEESNPSKIEDRLDEMVKKSLEKYPPKKN